MIAPPTSSYSPERSPREILLDLDATHNIFKDKFPRAKEEMEEKLQVSVVWVSGGCGVGVDVYGKLKDSSETKTCILCNGLPQKQHYNGFYTPPTQNNKLKRISFCYIYNITDCTHIVMM